MDNSTHYDHVTDAWIYILGDNLHYGYFDNNDRTLTDATEALIEKLASFATIDDHSSVLDVGCGIGAPAFYLYEKFGCTISGISTSIRGIEIAEKRCKEKAYSTKIRFHVRDALDNSFPDESFDLVWVMESSHLMKNKKKLFEESYRVLKNGGRMLLCDVILKKEFTILDVYNYQKELNVLEKTFGKIMMETLDFYKREMGAQRFTDIEATDISKQAFPTLTKWKENILSNREAVLKLFTRDDFDNFLLSCTILMDFFRDELIGYGLITGVK